MIDPTRAPTGQQTLWAYCHVPNGSNVDMRAQIEAQIERFAPGFRDLILAQVTTTARGEEAHNPSYVGGDIGAGAATLRQTVFRPTRAMEPVPHRHQGRVPVLGLHATRGWRPWHVR